MRKRCAVHFFFCTFAKQVFLCTFPTCFWLVIGSARLDTRVKCTSDVRLKTLTSIYLHKSIMLYALFMRAFAKKSGSAEKYVGYTYELNHFRLLHSSLFFNVRYRKNLSTNSDEYRRKACTSYIEYAFGNSDAVFVSS